jgi:hypothetical protein
MGASMIGISPPNLAQNAAERSRQEFDPTVLFSTLTY